jgi:hypothetical protein
MSIDVSEEHIAPIFRIEKISSARNLLSCYELHGVISQKIVVFTTTAVRISNPTCIFLV